MEHKPEYISWATMIQRCYNFEHCTYEYAGAKGITVCDKWRHSFEAFYKDVGPRPEGKPHLRILDKSKGYCPGNVKWMSKIEVNRSLPSTKLNMKLAKEIRAKANLFTNRQLAKEYHVVPSTICMLLRGETWKK